MPLTTSTRANKLPGFAGLDRKTMEEERLARTGKGKRKRDSSPVMSPSRETFNPLEGQAFSWQLGESAKDFVKRVPPLTTSAITCDWIWAANPYRNPSDKSKTPRVAEFKERGAKLLADSVKKRDEILEKGRLGPRTIVTRAWNQESRSLQQSLTKVAVETGVLSGKVSPVDLKNSSPQLTSRYSGCCSPRSRKSRAHGRLSLKLSQLIVLGQWLRWLLKTTKTSD